MAISCLVEGCSEKLINIENPKYLMLIGSYIYVSSVQEIATSHG